MPVQRLQRLLLSCVRPPLPCYDPPAPGKTHLQEKPPRLIIYMKMPMRLFGSPRRAACLLQYPASSRKSSSITDFLIFPAYRYTCALTIVSFPRSCIVSSVPATPLSSERPAVSCHPSPPFSHEFMEPVHLHFG
jgi:hypothetical protein